VEDRPADMVVASVAFVVAAFAAFAASAAAAFAAVAFAVDMVIAVAAAFVFAGILHHSRVEVAVVGTADPLAAVADNYFGCTADFDQRCSVPAGAPGAAVPANCCRNCPVETARSEEEAACFDTTIAALHLACQVFLQASFRVAAMEP